MFPHEKYAESIEVADQLSKTSYYWYIYGGNDYTGFNFNWLPDSWDRHRLHVFGDQWQRYGYTFFVRKNVVRDCPDVKNIIQFQEEQQCQRLPHPHLFSIPENVDIATVDTTWHHNVLEPEFTYHFPSQHQRASGVTYGQGPNKFSTAFVVSTLATTTNWTVPDDVEDVDYTWHPDPTQPPFIYEFATEYQKTSGLLYTVPGATEKKYTSLTRKVKRRANTEVYLVDFMTSSTQVKLDVLKNRGLDVKKTRFVGSYLDIIKRICTSATTEFVWVVSTLCDYTDFDFNWHPETWQSTMLHVFASNEQKFGDTFLVNVAEFKAQAERIKLLDWYDTVHYVPDVIVTRDPMPTFVYEQDTLVDAVNEYKFDDPYVLFTKGQVVEHTPKLWAVKDRDVHTFTTSNSIAQVPREVKQHVSEQIYDYPYISKHRTLSEQRLDTIFISNGEPEADKWFKRTQTLTAGSNRCIHVQGVQGRTNAYQEAARQSTTPWFFTVFGKLELLPEFPLDWQPDHLQKPKHYIFYSRNPVNGLCYGHMGVIAYNRELVLANRGQGLDFTLSQAHEVVPVVGSVAHFNDSPVMAWRTAFREVVKLKQFVEQSKDVEAEYRLKTWLTKAKGLNAEYVLSGANEGASYYDEVNGNPEQLQLSYEWAWLDDRFNSLHFSSQS